MIPPFPEFKKLELSDKPEIEKITSQFPPYSDFNFTSMWCWDVHDQVLVSLLDDNLIVQFEDYITGHPFLSFIGNHVSKVTPEVLLNYSIQSGTEDFLKLVPQAALEGLVEKESDFTITEDRSNFDYIYEIGELVSLQGRKYETQRNLINRFSRKYIDKRVTTSDLRGDENDRKVIIELVKIWSSRKNIFLHHEEVAVKRLLDSSSNFNLVNVVVYASDTPVGFCINEVLGNNYAIAHFAKADVSFSGVYAILMHSVANALADIGCKYLNYEQDLGLDELRMSKLAFRPHDFLKKYQIRIKK